MVMKPTHQPTIFHLVKAFLLLNIFSGVFMLTILLGAVLFDSFTHSFAKTEVVLDVRKSGPDTTRLNVTELSAYDFKQSNTGDLAMMMPWYSQLFVPFGFFNIPAFELSIPYWIFYSSLCFLFYRIINSTSIESPFSHKNIKRVFWVGYILIIYDTFTVIRFISLSIFVKNATNQTYFYDGLGPLIYFKIGILVIILAMIYRRGVAMQREQELTV